MEIRRAEIIDLDEVVNILNRVAKNLQEKGIHQWDYPWDRDKIEEEIKSEQAFILFNDKKAIGTFFIREIDCLSEMAVAPLSNYLNKIAILPEYQGKNIGAIIIDYACSFSHKLNKTLYLDCWAGNDKLKTFYACHGFKYRGDFPENDYLISVYQREFM